jgi:hypothetical protein
MRGGGGRHQLARSTAARAATWASSFAIPIDEASRACSEQLRARGRVLRGASGCRTDQVTKGRGSSRSAGGQGRGRAGAQRRGKRRARGRRRAVEGGSDHHTKFDGRAIDRAGDPAAASSGAPSRATQGGRSKVFGRATYRDLGGHAWPELEGRTDQRRARRTQWSARPSPGHRLHRWARSGMGCPDLGDAQQARAEGQETGVRVETVAEGAAARAGCARRRRALLAIGQHREINQRESNSRPWSRKDRHAQDR